MSMLLLCHSAVQTYAIPDVLEHTAFTKAIADIVLIPVGVLGERKEKYK